MFKDTRNKSLALLSLIVLQAICAGVFAYDMLHDLVLAPASVLSMHMVVEISAAVLLLISILIEVGMLRALLARSRSAERGLAVAQGHLSSLIDSYFDEWNLTPSEREVATFTIKGCDIAEIAGLRGSAEGTVKAHLNGIYRKAGVNGRSALVSLVIEDLMSQPLVGGN